MDFNRNTQQPGVTPGTSATAAAASRKSGKSDSNKVAKFGFVGLIATAAILLIAVAVAGATGGKSEEKLVDKSKLQAVFLSTGQVYFGNIESLTGSNFVVKNIYYLQTSNTGTEANANTNVSLVKLGCELHSPSDQMVINRSQVTFWENLKDDGQVAKAVATFQQQNPDGQKCNDAASNASTTDNVQGSPNIAPPAVPAATTPATTNTNR